MTEPSADENPFDAATGGDEQAEQEAKITAARKAFISQWIGRIQRAETYWEARMFKRMREDRLFAKGYQWQTADELLKDTTIPDDDRVVVNITQRHIKQQTATLYGKNPKIVCRHKERMILSVWDGSQTQLQQAMQQIQMAQQAMAQAQTGDPFAFQQAQMLMQQAAEAQAVLKEASEYKKYKQQARQLARTLELLIDHVYDEQPYDFKTKMKDMVRRALTCGLAYVKQTFHRRTEPVPENVIELGRLQNQLAAIERLASDAAKGDIDIDNDADGEQLRLRIKQLQSMQEAVVYEGLLLEYPDPTRLIADPAVLNLRTFEGASWLTEALYLTRPQIRDRYGKDVKGKAKTFRPKADPHVSPGVPGDASGDISPDAFATMVETSHTGGTSPGQSTASSEEDALFRIYEVYDKSTGNMFVLCDGMEDYIKEPSTPDYANERFFPYLTLMFNDPDSPGDVVPQSDVTLVRPMQQEINRAAQALREHRHANRPGWMSPKGVMDDDSRRKLGTRNAYDILELNLSPEQMQAIEKYLQALPTMGTDPNMFETGTAFQNILRVVGQQEAELGGLSGSTATEAAIAQGAKSTASGSDIEALDTFLSDLVKTGGQLLLANMELETVRKVVGPSALWPDLGREEIVREYYLEIEAGSTGKPNQAEEVQRFQALAPIIMQTPGVAPEWFLREAVRRLDDRIDVTEAMASGVPSIQSQNSAAGSPARPQGLPGQSQASGQTQPEAQGAQGLNNAPSTQPDQVNAAPRPPEGSTASGQNYGGNAQGVN